MQSHDSSRVGERKVETVVMASDDNGETWRELTRLPGLELALLFCPADRRKHISQRRGFHPCEPVCLLGFRAWRGDLVVVKSVDEGETWTAPSVLKEGKFWNTSTGHVVRDGRFYWCVGMPGEGEVWNKAPKTATIAMACDLSMDPTDPGAWRFSLPVEYPGTPDSLRDLGVSEPPTKSGPRHDHWLEGNMVATPGRLEAFYRIRMKGSSNMAASCLLDDDGGELRYRFARFHPLPGAQNHFHIISDPAAEIYWMCANLVPLAGTRRVLGLQLSLDARHWIPAAYLIAWRNESQASNYCTPLIDGNDLLIVCRTSRQAPNYHDNDLITFHRARDFRRLLAPLLPGPRDVRGPSDSSRARDEDDATPQRRVS